MTPTNPHNQPDNITLDQVRRIAHLARLSLSDDQLRALLPDLASTLAHVSALAELNLDGVEPMPHVGDQSNRFDADIPGPTLSNDILMAIAPHAAAPFIRVPKVLPGNAGGA